MTIRRKGIPRQPPRIIWCFAPSFVRERIHDMVAEIQAAPKTARL
jgi:hypothetical protein